MELLLEDDGSYEITIDVTTSSMYKSSALNIFGGKQPRELITIMGQHTQLLEHAESVN